MRPTYGGALSAAILGFLIAWWAFTAVGLKLEAQRPSPCCMCADCREHYSDPATVKMLGVNGRLLIAVTVVVGVIACLPVFVLVLMDIAGAIRAAALGRAHQPGHCRKCGYDLTGLPTNRCPECGLEFVSVQPRRPTPKCDRWADELYNLARLCLFGASGIGLLLAILGLVTFVNVRDWRTPVAAVAGAAPIGALAIWIRFRQRTREARDGAGMLLAFMVPVGVILLLIGGFCIALAWMSWPWLDWR